LLDNFDDRYLGAKTSDPALDNDGNALLLGALYFNTTDGVMKVYTASGWIAASSASVATLATFEFVATSGQTVFTGNDANGSSLSYVAPALIVTLNGVRLRPGDDYTATNGTSITLVSAAALNDELVVDAFGSFLVANTYTIAEVDAFAVKLTGNQSIAGNKNFAGNLLYVDDTNDKVGVGTTSPGDRFHVYENTSYVGIKLQNQTSFITTFVHDGLGGHGFIYKSGAYDTAFYNNDVETMRVKSGGNFQFNSGYGSVATAYGCRAWVNFNGTGTISIRASGNVSSITDNGSGDYTINFSSAMPDGNYAVSMSVRPLADSKERPELGNTTSTNALRVINDDGMNTLIDTDLFTVAVFR
jgi:hypothetical protein